MLLVFNRTLVITHITLLTNNLIPAKAGIHGCTKCHTDSMDSRLRENDNFFWHLKLAYTFVRLEPTDLPTPSGRGYYF